MYDGSEMGTPIILSLYLIESFISAAILAATNSLPKVLDSKVFCLLEYQVVGEPFRKKIKPVVDRLVLRHVA